MTDRRTFLASLFAPLLGWFRRKAHIGVDLASGESETVVTIHRPPDLNVFCTLPVDRIDSLITVEHRMFGFTTSGLYEIFGDGRYGKLSYRCAEPDRPDIAWEWT